MFCWQRELFLWTPPYLCHLAKSQNFLTQNTWSCLQTIFFVWVWTVTTRWSANSFNIILCISRVISLCLRIFLACQYLTSAINFYLLHLNKKILTSFYQIYLINRISYVIPSFTNIDLFIWLVRVIFIFLKMWTQTRWYDFLSDQVFKLNSDLFFLGDKLVKDKWLIYLFLFRLL